MRAAVSRGMGASAVHELTQDLTHWLPLVINLVREAPIARNPDQESRPELGPIPPVQSIYLQFPLDVLALAERPSNSLSDRPQLP